MAAKGPTGAERYLRERLHDADYRAEYELARRRIDRVDGLIRALDDRRKVLDLTKAELARRAGMPPEAVRRLFTAEGPNPTLQTVVALAEALGLDLTPIPMPSSGAPGTRQPRA